MNREIESDGYITREQDVAPRKRICFTCKFYKHDPNRRRYVCTQGHKVGAADWRMKYEVCDKWEKRQ